MNTTLTFRVALPMILAGIFISIIFFAMPGAIQIGPAFFIILFFVCVFIFFYGFSTGQNISFPVRKLLKRATDLSKGDLKARSYVDEKDEIGQLAKIFNKIADELEASRASQEVEEKSVGVKVQARTKELEETIDALEQKVKNRTFELERLIGESNKLQTAVKEKGTENDQLKKEIDDLRQKVGGQKLSKKNPKKVDTDNAEE